jgi:hypothetical protein
MTARLLELKRVSSEQAVDLAATDHPTLLTRLAELCSQDLKPETRQKDALDANGRHPIRIQTRSQPFAKSPMMGPRLGASCGVRACLRS